MEVKPKYPRFCYMSRGPTIYDVSRGKITQAWIQASKTHRKLLSVISGLVFGCFFGNPATGLINSAVNASWQICRESDILETSGPWTFFSIMLLIHLYYFWQKTLFKMSLIHKLLIITYYLVCTSTSSVTGKHMSTIDCLFVKETFCWKLLQGNVIKIKRISVYKNSWSRTLKRFQTQRIEIFLLVLTLEFLVPRKSFSC